MRDARTLGLCVSKVNPFPLPQHLLRDTDDSLMATGLTNEQIRDRVHVASRSRNGTSAASSPCSTLTSAQGTSASSPSSSTSRTKRRVRDRRDDHR
uniref:Uncharacterized protein n=1 Tax=Trueperella pyogenes TaxID=1661 RepID=Q6X4U5_9ACTO|nr:unknown [Trueperella pyogenes]